MPDLIPDDEIERLSRKLRSLSYDEFRLSLEQPDEIPDRFYDSIEIAWQVSFPIWRESGRVQDLPHGIHVPKYFASFAKRLGTHFAEVYRDDFSYLIDLLRTMPINSYEYLIAYDLLKSIAYEFYLMEDMVVCEKIWAIDLPVPLAIEREKSWDIPFHGLDSIGAYIHQSCVVA